MVIIIIAISIGFLVVLLVNLLILKEMKCQSFKLFSKNKGPSRDYEVTPLIPNPKFDEKNHQILAEIQNQIKTITKTLSGAAAPSIHKKGDSLANNSSKFYILQTNVSKLIDFDIESLRVTEICTKQITIKSIFDNNKKVPLSYSIVESVGKIREQIANSLDSHADNIILFFGSKNLNDDVLLFNIDIEQLEFCYLMPLVDVNIREHPPHGNISKIYKYTDSEELVLKKYPWDLMKILKENEAILNELETFQITKSHEGFVRLNGVFTDKYYFYVSMEKMEGSIKDYIANNHPLPEEIIAKWAKQILLALKYLHDRDIPHLNIKPSSILLDKDGNIKLSIFGLAKYLRCGVKSRRSKEFQQSLSDTYRFMASEHYSNEICGVEADVWSFRATMIEITTGIQPFDGIDERNVVNEIGQTLTHFNLDETRSPELKDFIDKCLKVDRNNRATVDDLLKHVFLNL